MRRRTAVPRQACFISLYLSWRHCWSCMIQISGGKKAISRWPRSLTFDLQRKIWPIPRPNTAVIWKISISCQNSLPCVQKRAGKYQLWKRHSRKVLFSIWTLYAWGQPMPRSVIANYHGRLRLGLTNCVLAWERLRLCWCAHQWCVTARSVKV